MLHNSLKALRCRLNMTQEQLARRSGATRRTILDIEQGRRAPRPSSPIALPPLWASPSPNSSAFIDPCSASIPASFGNVK